MIIFKARSTFYRLLYIGKINMVITKDLSRLGRDHVMTCYYVETFFPENDVRYIVVNDDIDTFFQTSGSDMMPFKLSMNAFYADDKEELQALTGAIKMAKNTGYGIVYPSIKELKLETPELVKQGSRYGVKLKAVASSIHMLKVDVESTFEPIIGSELQSKELINRLMKDYENDSSSIWKSEIFGRSLEAIVQEGIQAKLSMMPDNTRYKLKETVTKIVNKGSNTLIAIVI